MSLDKQFNTVNEKLLLLVKQQQRLKRENEQLRQALAEEKRKEQGYLRHIDNLETAVALLKVAVGDMTDRDKKDFEKKINQYIRDIDRCIAFLSK